VRLFLLRYCAPLPLRAAVLEVTTLSPNPDRQSAGRPSRRLENFFFLPSLPPSFLSGATAIPSCPYTVPRQRLARFSGCVGYLSAVSPSWQWTSLLVYAVRLAADAARPVAGALPHEQTFPLSPPPKIRRRRSPGITPSFFCRWSTNRHTLIFDERDRFPPLIPSFFTRRRSFLSDPAPMPSLLGQDVCAERQP